MALAEYRIVLLQSQADSWLILKMRHENDHRGSLDG
jgi:hypothetical protein